MSTRSIIAVMHGNKAKAVYCHWDGYVAHNGAILNEHYDSVKANKLVSMGDLSSLGANIGEAHPFSEHDIAEDDANRLAKLALHKRAEDEEWCTFYGRDRGEEDTGYQTFQSLNDMLEAAEGRWAEYAYILKGNEWFYTKRTVIQEDEQFVTVWAPLEFLSEALKTKEAV